jgi:hypothetical protein
MPMAKAYANIKLPEELIKEAERLIDTENWDNEAGENS